MFQTQIKAQTPARTDRHDPAHETGQSQKKPKKQNGTFHARSVLLFLWLISILVRCGCGGRSCRLSGAGIGQDSRQFRRRRIVRSLRSGPSEPRKYQKEQCGQENQHAKDDHNSDTAVFFLRRRAVGRNRGTILRHRLLRHRLLRHRLARNRL